MAILSMGAAVTVSAAGTPVAVAANYWNTKQTSIHGILIQALPGNTGKVYIGSDAMDKSTMANVYAVLPVPTTNFVPSFSAALTIAPNALKLSDFYIDVDVNNEGALVSVLAL